MTVQEFDDDEALLLDAAGREIETWRQDYPYDERMSREEYATVERGLQIELLEMQSWVKFRHGSWPTCAIARLQNP